MHKLLVALLLLVAATASASDAQRIVTLGGDVTEIVYALGAGEYLVGVDATSLYPPQADELPDVGYVRQLNAEGILALDPVLVIGSADAGPPQAISQLRDAGVAVEILPDGENAAIVAAKVRRVAVLLHRDAEGERLARDIEAKFAALAADVARTAHKPRVLFLLSAGPGSPLAAGTETAAAAMIELTGGDNAGAGFSGYKPLNSEALATLAPDVILVMRERLPAGGIDRVRELAGVALTPAAQSGRIVAMDGMYLLTFGPRSADAARELFSLLHEPAGDGAP